MNLAYKYPIIYWNCACLSVDSSAINGADFYNLVDDDIIDTDDVDGKKVQNKMDYAKLASALDKSRGICKIDALDNDSYTEFQTAIIANEEQELEVIRKYANYCCDYYCDSALRAGVLH